MRSSRTPRRPPAPSTEIGGAPTARRAGAAPGQSRGEPASAHGDNEWTDCHRPNNGGYNPLERLAKVRATFFPSPGRTLGQHQTKVSSQADQGYPENVTYDRAGVAFVAVHIVGSNNSLAPWTGSTAPTPEQTTEVLGRTAADIGLRTVPRTRVPVQR